MKIRLFFLSGLVLFAAAFIPGAAASDLPYNLVFVNQEIKTESYRTGILLETYQEEAEAYIDGKYMGKTPILIVNLLQGAYRVELKKDGYRTLVMNVNLPLNVIKSFNFNLERVSGFIIVTAEPPDAVITMDGIKITETQQEIPVGRYQLSVRSFGYGEYRETVTIADSVSTARKVTLGKAAFDVSGIKASRSVLNPRNPGSLGRTRLSFSVTAPGSGRIALYNDRNEKAAEFKLPEFTGWDQVFEWDGAGSGGQVLTDGVYSLVLTAQGDDGIPVSGEVKVSLDSSRTVPFRSVFHGSPGLLFAQTTDSLPKGMTQLSFLALGRLSYTDSVWDAGFPVAAGFRFSPVDNLDCALSVAGVPQVTVPIPLSAGGSVTWRYLRTPGPVSLSMAASIRATYQAGETYDSFTNYAGVYAGLPLQFSAGPFGISLTPEFAFSPKRISYTAGETYPVQPVYAWGYARAGVFLDFGTIGTGVSYALRLKPFSEGFGIQMPMSAGWEFWFFIPGSRVVLEAAIAAEFGSAMYSVSGGLGISILN